VPTYDNRSLLKNNLVVIAKVLVSAMLLGLLAWQFWRVATRDPEAFRLLIYGSKNWWLLAAALGLALSSVIITFLRWHLLVRALGLAFPVQEALRLGFVGFLLNFTVSIFGGDLIKAVAIARRQPGHEAASAATVVIDRLFGLYALFFVGAVASLWIDFDALRAVAGSAQVAAAERVCNFTQIATVVGALGFALLLAPGLATSPLWEAMIHIPHAGPTLVKLLEAVRIYRRRWWVLVAAFLMSVVVHCLSSMAIYSIGRGLPGEDPTLAANFVVAPIAMVAGAAPLPGGLGAFEGALAFMYQALSPPGVAALQGLVIAVAYRLITLLIAAVGGVYYFLGRREVNQLISAAKHQPA
jgi:uncharacterized membrane protein YbhN (UPF0104 family)